MVNKYATRKGVFEEGRKCKNGIFAQKRKDQQIVEENLMTTLCQLTGE